MRENESTQDSLFSKLFGTLYELAVCNLLFLLFCLPVITIGPAWMAMTRVNLDLLEHRDVRLFHDFWTYFKSNLKRGVWLGLAVAAVLLLAVFAYTFYIGYTDEFAIFYLPAFLTVVCAVIIVFILIYLFPMLAMTDLPVPLALRNGLLLSLAHPARTLAAILGCLVFSFLWLLIPYTIPILLLLYFSGVNVAFCICAYQPIQEHVLRGKKDMPTDIS
ncbi:MAG: DUF624 domain-containing protein [Clostridiales bacterium]|nr:DUF624 domain-containing protein [Clostridiales bacterium]